MDIIKHLRQPGWKLTASKQSLVIDTPDELAAKEFIRKGNL